MRTERRVMPMRQFGTANNVQLATRIPKELHRAVRRAAFDAEVPLMTYVAEALTEHLARCRRQPQDREE
jgi:predicted HicB family RNase H-like nuclease